MGKWTLSSTTPDTRAKTGIISAVGSHEQRLAVDEVIGAIHSLEIGDGFVDAAFRKGPDASRENSYGIDMLRASYKPNEMLPQEDSGNWTIIRFEGRGAEHVMSRFEALNELISRQPKQREL